MHLETLHVNLRDYKLIEILFLNFVFLLIHIYILHIILLVLSYTYIYV